MKRYLVAVDGSESASNALEHAIDCARATAPAEIHVLHVVPPIESAELRIYSQRDDIGAVMREANQRVLADAVDQVKAAGIPQAGHLLDGKIADTIAQFADRQNMDGIIMGTRGLGMLGAMMLGSVSSRVLHLAHVPVTFVK